MGESGAIMSGAILMWFLLTVVAVVFVAIDIQRTPESPVLKWAFVLLVAYTGPIGAFLYVLGCREPLPGLHAAYTSTRWRQALGSTMHCVAGDGLGILAGAIVSRLVETGRLSEFLLEYGLGFGFGWTIFQALFMKDSAGGSFLRALRTTFVPELISMNYLMGVMVVVMGFGMEIVPESSNPASMGFWFVMSMALLAGFAGAFPANLWLVSRGLKHGMMTVRPGRPPSHSEHRGAVEVAGQHAVAAASGHSGERGSHAGPVAGASVGRGEVGVAIAVSFAVLGVGWLAARLVAGH